MILYNYEDKKIKYNLEKTSNKNNYIKEYRLTYNSPYQTGIEINDRVYAKLFLNKNVAKGSIDNLSDDTYKIKNDIIIFVHGFSTSKRKLENYYHFINKINLSNLSCAFIDLPFHLNRTPEGEKSGERLIYFDDVKTLLFFHQCVVDIKKLIDILSVIIAVRNIYICGISLGSMISLITMANEDRIDKGVFLIGGGNWEEIHWKGFLRFILRGNCIYENKKYKNKTRRKACKEFYSNFPVFLKKIKELKYKNLKMDLSNSPELKEPELKEVTTKMCFLCDPLTFAHKIKPEKVLMINSKFDFYFSKTSTLQLWEELGRPKIYWLNKLHSSKILTDEKIIAEVKNFLLNT